MVHPQKCLHRIDLLGNVMASVLCFSVTVTLLAQAQGGEVRGKILVPENDELSEELFRGRSLLRYEMHLHTSAETVPPYRLSEKAAVYVESVPPAQIGYAPPETHPQLNQSQMLFRPLVLPVLVGTTVDFPN